MKLIILGKGANDLADLFLRLDWEYEEDAVNDDDYDLPTLLTLIADIRMAVSNAHVLVTENVREI